MTGSPPSRAAVLTATRRIALTALTALLLIVQSLGCSRPDPAPDPAPAPAPAPTSSASPAPAASRTEASPKTETGGHREDTRFPGRITVEGPTVEGARQPTVGGGEGWRYVAWMTPDALGQRASVHVAARSEEDERWRDPTVLTASADPDHPLRMHDATPRRLAVTWSASAGQAPARRWWTVSEDAGRRFEQPSALERGGLSAPVVAPPLEHRDPWIVASAADPTQAPATAIAPVTGGDAGGEAVDTEPLRRVWWPSAASSGDLGPLRTMVASRAGGTLGLRCDPGHASLLTPSGSYPLGRDAGCPEGQPLVATRGNWVAALTRAVDGRRLSLRVGQDPRALTEVARVAESDAEILELRWMTPTHVLLVWRSARGDVTAQIIGGDGRRGPELPLASDATAASVTLLPSSSDGTPTLWMAWTEGTHPGRLQLAEVSLASAEAAAR